MQNLCFLLVKHDDLKMMRGHFSLSATDIALLNPNTRTCPIFRSKRDIELTKAIYTSCSCSYQRRPTRRESMEYQVFYNVSYGK